MSNVKVYKYGYKCEIKLIFFLISLFLINSTSSRLVSKYDLENSSNKQLYFIS